MKILNDKTRNACQTRLLSQAFVLGLLSILIIGCFHSDDDDTTDTNPPTVSSNSPDNGATDIPVGVELLVTFSEAMNATTISTASFTLVDASSSPVSGAVIYNSGSKTATFTPTVNLAANMTYTAMISTTVKDVAGNALAAIHSWSFTTISSDTTPPEVSATNPLKRARGALLSGPITANFTEALDPVTVNVGSFIVIDPVGAVSGTVSVSPDRLTASFTPNTPFNYKTRYDVQLTTAISDLAGNQLAVDYDWHFNSGKRLAAGRAHTCARLDDGGLKCWGGGFDGQLGLGDARDRGDEADEMGINLPRVNLGTDRKVLQVVAGNWHNCVRLDNATVKCWGANNGMLGLGDTDARGFDASEMGDNLPTVNLGSSRTALELVAGGWHTCARLDNNNVKCWGTNPLGQLGRGDTDTRGDQAGEMGGNLLKVELGTDRKARELSAGLSHTCARLDNGSVKCWGENTYGQLGLGDTNHRGDDANELGDALPAINFGSGRTVVGIETNGEHTCARLDNNTLKCWGRNILGQLGQGDTNDRGDNETIDSVSAVDLGSGRTALGLAMGYWHSCARLDNGSLKCWGYNHQGQVGQGDIDTRGDQAGEMGDNLDVVNLGTDRTVLEIVSKFEHNCARLDDNSVKCWGVNHAGQLGQGDTNNRGDDSNEMGDNLLVVDIGN